MPEFTKDRRKSRDRRIAPRSAASGIVEISVAQPVPVTIKAELVETSATGFRASYDAKGLEPGIQIHFQRDGARGEARVMWTHQLNGRRASGFLLL